MFNKTLKLFGVDQQTFERHQEAFVLLQRKNEAEGMKFREINAEIILGDEYCYKKVQTKGMWSGKIDLPEVGTDV